MTDTVGKISFAWNDPLSRPDAYKGSTDVLWASREKVLRNFVKWFDRYEREWGDEYRESDEFLDLRDIYDAARASLLGVA
jgi:hypothetical protein